MCFLSFECVLCKALLFHSPVIRPLPPPAASPLRAQITATAAAMSSAATATARLRCVGCLVKLRYEPDAVFITCPRCETRFNPKLLASVRLHARTCFYVDF
jgi:hypothetical protein